MAFLGYFISLIGLGPSTAEPRFTSTGGRSWRRGPDRAHRGPLRRLEVFIGLEESRVAITQKIRNVFPRLADLRRPFPRSRGRALASSWVLPELPRRDRLHGLHVERSSEASERFGKVAIERVSAESATTRLLVRLHPPPALGIPPRRVGVLLGGLLVYGPAWPLRFQKNPEFVWTVIASLYVGNVIC